MEQPQGDPPEDAELNQRQAVDGVQRGRRGTPLRYWRRFAQLGLDRHIELLLALAIASFAAGQWVTSCNNNSSTSKQSERLLDSANRIDGAADSFSKSSADVSRSMQDAVGKLNLQAAEAARLASATEKASAVSREDAIAVQRASVYYAGILAQPVHRPTGSFTWEVSIRWQNSGPTRAEDVVSVAKIAALDDEQFRNLDFTVSPDDLRSEGTISPGLPYYVGIGEEPRNFAADISNGFHVVYWGWLGYRDIFSGTKPHIAEFCVEVTEMIGPVDAQGKLIVSREDEARFSYRDCALPRQQHNCDDQSCKDYEKTAALVK